MEASANPFKGIHPGLVLDRELKKRKIKKGQFALSIQEYPQLLGEITKGRRKMNVPLSLKIEKTLGLAEGYLMQLQVYFDIKIHKEKLELQYQPDISKFRPALFWETDIHKINWIRQKAAVLQRISERGNDIEQQEIANFYKQEEVQKLISNG